LDANTTGVVVYATKKRYAQAIFPQFQNATVEKTYLARVLGHFDNDRFVCDQPISDQASTAGTRIVSPDGRSALTEFEVIERLQDGTSLVICRPKTGRTNQIRIHLAHLGFPIKGDAAYCVDHDQSVTQTSSPTDPPMCLHAWKIRLDHPETGQRVAFEAQCPDWANAAGGQTLPPDNA
jgi:RluA family pseudouridine synthase